MNSRLSSDSLEAYGLKILQPVTGYRFSLDALLLAGFAGLPEAGTVADLGTGSAVIPLILARKNPAVRCAAFENNPEMAELARTNVSSNGLDDRVEVIGDDILQARRHFPVSSFDLVVSNPPFRSPGSGKTSPHAGRDTARHETTAGLADFMAAAKYLVKPSGRICFIYPPSRLSEFIRCAGELKLALLRLRMVHGHRRAVAKMFLAELAKGSRGGLTVEAPLVVYDGDGGYTEELAALLGGEQLK